MFKTICCVVLLVFISTSFSLADADDPTLVTVPNGQIRGHLLQTRNGKNYYAFQQIPFAEPPVGNLRFKEPVPASNWQGELNATQNTKICYQQTPPSIPPGVEQTEDCLYLNVYVPANATGALPILFWIHGGSYIFGDGTFQSVGPQFFMSLNGTRIIIVTTNYRLGALGFVTTEDGVIPGNLALKDQNLALQWVQENIQYFGGDPSKVTVGGESAGGSSAGLHLVSKKSSGLFRAVILQSGTAIMRFSYQPFARFVAFNLARVLDPTFTSDSSTDLLNFLLNVPAANITNAGALVTTPWKADANNAQWRPVIEDANLPGAFITGPMEDDVEHGNINRVPIIIGFNSEESLSFYHDAVLAQGVLYDSDLSNLVNITFNMTDEDMYIAGSKLRSIYTNETFEEDYGALIRYVSDSEITTPQIRHAALQSIYNHVYLYQFSYSGTLGRLPILGTTPTDIEGVDPNGVAHGEDIFYLWDLTGYNDDIDSFPATDGLVQSYFLKLWTNFVKYLNPTPLPDPTLGYIIWPNVFSPILNYLNLNSTLSIQLNPKQYRKWKPIISEYAIPPLIIY